MNPGYDAVIKCSHAFNLLDARGAISVSERVGYIGRVRKLARKAAVAYAKLREELGFPLIKDEAERAKWVKPAVRRERRSGGRRAAGKARRRRRPGHEPRPAVRDRRRGAAGRLHPAGAGAARARRHRGARRRAPRARRGAHARHAAPARALRRGARGAPARPRRGGDGPGRARGVRRGGQAHEGAARLLPGQGRRPRGRAAGRDAEGRVRGRDRAPGGPARGRGAARAARRPRPRPHVPQGDALARRRHALRPAGALAGGAARRRGAAGARLRPRGRARVARPPLPRARARSGSPARRTTSRRSSRPACWRTRRRAQARIGGADRRRVAAAQGGRPVADEELLEICSYLVEWPTAFAGSFDEHYLDLPREVIVTALREHQRFFAVEREDGTLLPCFIAVRNGDERGLDVIRRGNEGVLIARLEDAKFYWETDLKHPPAARVEALAGVVWMEGLGSLREKAARLEALAGLVARAHRAGGGRGGAARGAAVQDRPALRDDRQRQGVREPRGRDGRALRAPRGRARGRGRGHRRALPAARAGRRAARDATRARCSRSRTSSTTWPARSSRARCRAGARTPTACAAPRTAWCASWSSRGVHLDLGEATERGAGAVPRRRTPALARDGSAAAARDVLARPGARRARGARRALRRLRGGARGAARGATAATARAGATRPTACSAGGSWTSSAGTSASSRW